MKPKKTRKVLQPAVVPCAAAVLTVFAASRAFAAPPAGGRKAQGRPAAARAVTPRPQVPAGRDAFLPYQVNSTDELLGELSRNPGLRARYARHFGIPESRVADFVRSTLIPYRLPESRVVTAYGVTKNGRIYAVRTRLKAGTRVWATRSGLPVLRWACANPLTKKLPGTLLGSKPRPSGSRGVPAPPVASIPSPALAAPVPAPLAGEASPELAAPAPVAVETSALIPPPPLSGGGFIALPPAPGVSGPGGGGIGPGIIPILLPIAGVVIGSPGGGGGSTPPPEVLPPPGGGTGGIPVPPAVTPPGTPIPEPGTLALCGAAAAPLLIRVVKRRRNRI